METTNQYTHKIALTDVHTSVRHFLQRFAKKHADTFNALSRAGNPYGGNWRQTNGTPTKNDVDAGDSTQQLIRLQQQVKALSQLVVQLSDQVQAQPVDTQLLVRSATSQAKPGKWSDDIGLKRFQSLQAAH